MTPDMWHLTPDTVHVTCDTEGVVNIVSTFQVPSSKFWEKFSFEDLEENDQWQTDWLNELINDNHVCRTARYTGSVKYLLNLTDGD